MSKEVFNLANRLRKAQTFKLRAGLSGVGPRKTEDSNNVLEKWDKSIAEEDE